MTVNAASLRFALAFVLARAALFVAPILLANLIPVAAYGRLETAQSLGSILSVITAFGLSSTVPLILIRADHSARWDTLLLLVGAGSAVLLVLAALGGLAAGDPGSPWLLVPLATAALMLQGLWSTVLKSRGNGTAAVFVEASFWLAALAGGLVWTLAGASMAWLALPIFGHCAVLLGVTLRAWLPVRAPFGLPDLHDNLRLAAPLLLTAILSILVSTAGRTIIGLASPGEAVGLYAVLYRATALPLVAHQLLIIWQFRQIFRWDDATAARLLPLIVAAVAASALALWLVIPPLGWLLGGRFIATFAGHGSAGAIILAQTVLWSAIAINDLLNSRLKIAGAVAMGTAPFLLLAAAALFAFLRMLPAGAGTASVLDHFVLGYAALMLGFYIVQCAVMHARGARFPLLWGIAIASFLGLALLSRLPTAF